MYIERNITEYLKNVVNNSPVTIVTGSRQVGKSTLLRRVFNDYTYVSFDDIEILELARTDVKAFFKKYNSPLIIDEFQYEPNILHEIKIKVDNLKYDKLTRNIKNENLHFILTGSQRFETMRNVKESLAGRVSIINLYGLSSRELEGKTTKAFIPSEIDLNYKNISNQNLFEKIFVGSYPELQHLNGRTKDEFFDNYINTYIERDIKSIIDVTDKIKFVGFMRNVAARTAQELNLVDICNGLGISSVTGHKWLSLLVDTNIVFLLEPYFNNSIKRIIKRPKLHFFDTGLCTYLAGYHTIETLERSAFSGAIFETYVITEIIKSYVNAGLSINDKFYYIRNSNNVEIDFIILDKNTIYPIEIKKSYSPPKDAIKSFSILKSADKKIGTGFVICNRDNCFPIDEVNYMIPASII